jgi:hypothetical protein
VKPKIREQRQEEEDNYGNVVERMRQRRPHVYRSNTSMAFVECADEAGKVRYERGNRDKEKTHTRLRDVFEGGWVMMKMRQMLR